jgi:hypothetical protein
MNVVGRTMMRAALNSLAVCMGFCLMALAVALPVAFAEGSSALSATGGPPLESALVVPGAQLLLGGEGVRDAEEARLSSPEAVRAREESETKYESLDGEEAVKLAGERFPVLVDEPAGGPPKLPAGESITSFPSANAAQVDLGGGEHGVIDSVAPIAVETLSGQRLPVDLSLRDAGEAFEPRTSVTGVRIPKQLSGGVVLPDSGVSLTPVSAQGAPLGGSEGVVDGASVVYANTQTDTDTVIKPTTLGFDASTVLRSVNSRQQLFFRVGLPAGASLVQSSDGTGGVRVVEEETVIASVQPPVAVDATGRAVPVSMTVSGDRLALTVDLPAGEYEYPVYVDPTVTDKELLFKPGNWAFFTDNKLVFEGFKVSAGLEDTDYKEKEDNTYYGGQYGFFSYTTQGASRIYAFVATAKEEDFEGTFDDVADEFELRRGNGEVESGNGEGGKAEKKYEEKAPTNVQV